MLSKSKLLVVLVAVIIVASAGIYVLTKDNTDKTRGDLTLTDYYGNEFTITDNIERTVVESGGALRFVSYMGDDAINTIVGSTLEKSALETGSTSYSYVDMPDYKYLSDCTKANIENIKILDPDLLIVGCSKSKLTDTITETITSMKAIGIPVCVVRYLDDVTQEDYKTQVKLMGQIFDCEDRAKKLIDGTQKILDDLNSRMSSAKVSKNVYVGGVSYMGVKGFLWSNVAYGGMLYLDSSKIVNVATEINPSATYQVELEWDDIYNYQKDKTIDLALLDMGGYNIVKADYTGDKAPYMKVDAIAEGDFYYILPQTSSGTLHDNTLIAAYIIGTIVCPDQFKDVDLTSVAKEIWSLFMDSDSVGEDIYDGMTKYIGGITGTDALHGAPTFAT